MTASLNSTFPPAASKTISAVASNVISAPESISAITGVVKVLFVSVSVETKDTKVELAPAGNNIVFVTLALWGCAITVCPCELDSQLNTIAPEFVLPLTTTVPVPLGAKSIVALEVVTISAPFISRLPPNCGVVSSTTFDIALSVASPATTADLAIFLSPPPEVSIAIKTSSLAAVYFR